MEIDRELYEKITNLTMTDYKPIYQPDAEAPVIITRAKMESMLEDLLIEISDREEKIDNIKKDMEDNYKRIPVQDQVE